MQVLIVYDVSNSKIRDEFRQWLESHDFEYIQDSVYSREFPNKDAVSEFSEKISSFKDTFDELDDVRLFEFIQHWHPVERERIRFFVD